MIQLKENIPLNDFTTLHLGGDAQYFCSCSTIDDLKEAMEYARTNGVRTHILGGGSNTIFSDSGFDGLVIKIDLKGISFVQSGENIIATVKAGEQWDAFVRSSVEHGYAGIECLSGIPGSVGATPIQNVGAYGQEVKETIVAAKVIDRNTLREIQLTNIECGFSYRTSRFKTYDNGKFIVTEVMYRLKMNGRPSIHYPEVKKTIDTSVDLNSLADGKESLEAVRNVVLSLRRKKSMVIDPADLNSRSVGSFFLNPIVDDGMFVQIVGIWNTIGDGTSVPSFPFENKKKIPAAWLIERSGFKKGYKKEGVGISENHTLALVNNHGTTKALLMLADEIRNGVERTFHLRLELEANVIS